MEGRSHSDDLAMTLVEEALHRPDDERETFLRRACGSNLDLYAEALTYVQWERRMQGFLLDPLLPAPGSRPPFEAGQLLINRFLIVREVAQGGMGIVWEAIDQKLDRRVALKCAKEGFGKQLPPEVRNAREISHPNVCKIFEIHTASTADGEIDFISMEFVEGETLAERIRRAPIPKRDARTIAEQLCSGLAEAHRMHLVHGDLKTNNIAVTESSDGSLRAVIMDFGLAQRADTSAGVLGGTPAYMAPELWKGEKVSVASDIYALGVLLWELRYGRSPSDLGVASETLPMGERTSWKPPQGRSRWDRIIARCLHPDPKLRFHSAAEVAKAFRLSPKIKWLLATAASVVVVAGSGAISYQRATAPTETAQLALLPFTSAPETSLAATGKLLHDTANQLAELKGSSHTRYRFISLDSVIRDRVHTPDEARVLLGATHLLRASLERRGESTTVHAFLTDLRSGVDVRDWTADYNQQEIYYASTALAGVVTNALRLPAPVRGAWVNAAARHNYLAGLADVRQDSTINRAFQQLSQAKRADSDSALILAALAEAQWFKYVITHDKNWLKPAAESLRQAQLRNPDLPQVHRAAGLLLAHEGRYDRAAGEYQRAIELDPKDGEAYRRLGVVFGNSDRNEEALAAFKKATLLDPQLYRTFRDLGDFYRHRGKSEEAITNFQKALQFAPGEVLVRNHLGQAYMDGGQFASAEAELRRSLSIKETPTAVQTLGLVLMYQSRDREAIPLFLRALKLGPQRCEWWTPLGIAYRRSGLLSESKQAFQNGIDIAERELVSNPSSGLYRAYVGFLSAQLGDRRRAEAEIAQALQSSPKHTDVLWIAAITYEALQQRNETLSVVANFPAGLIADLNRWPDVAELRENSRFQQLVMSSRR